MHLNAKCSNLPNKFEDKRVFGERARGSITSITVCLPDPDPLVDDQWVFLPAPDRNGCRYSCKSCFFRSRSEEDINAHCSQMHEPVRREVCPYCRGVFKNRKSLSQHISANHRELHAKTKRTQQQQQRMFY